MLGLIRKTLGALALFGLLSGPAAAIGQYANYSFGTLSGSQGVTVDSFSGTFDNTFDFTLGNSFSGVQGLVLGLDAVGDMSVQFRTGFGAAPTWGSWSVLMPVISDEYGNFGYSTVVSGLQAGQHYWLQLQGNASLATYSLTLAPVPEPESWAMLIAGLGLMGVIARRRRAAI